MPGLDGLRVHVMGDLRVFRGRDRVVLTPSKKTRALLAYLVATARSHSREHLCDLLWDGPDDPRAGLRWSLAKLRPLLEADGVTRLLTDRDRVTFAAGGAETDLMYLTALADRGVASATTETLAQAATLFSGEFAEGLDLPACFRFHEWCIAERERWSAFRLTILTALIDRLSGTPESALVHARARVAIDPLDEGGHAAVIRLLVTLGRQREALHQYEYGCQILAAELGTKPGADLESAIAAVRPPEPRHDKAKLRSAAARVSEDMALVGRSDERAALDGLALAAPPDRPSLVVLPFWNLSNDIEQDYFADGITEELTTELSRLRWIFVIARNSAFTYKGRAVDVRQVGRELGVRYILQGSVRKSSNRVRISSQLVEAESRYHLWADRFTGDLQAIFDLQDRITEAVVGQLEPSLRSAEIERARRKSPGSLDAYDLYLRALPEYHAMTEPGSTAAQALLRQALYIEPRFAFAKSLFAACQVRREAEGWAKPGEREEAAVLARQGLIEMPREPTVLAQGALAIAYLAHAHEEAQEKIMQALALCPNSPLVEGNAGLVYMYGCLPDLAILHFEHAMRLSPLDPSFGSFLMGIAFAHQMAERLEKAIEFGRAAIRASPQFGAPRRVVVSSLAMLGRMEEARQAAEELRRTTPAAYRVFAQRLYERNPDKAYAERIIQAYRAVGFPE
jgi:TolB-like protein/DNA-binding SARP family transcriptional activator